MVRYDLKKGCFGVMPFHVAPHPHNCISTNGLPIPHNAVRVIGNFSDIRSLRHPNICQYLDLVRGKGELMCAVQEWHERTLLSTISSPPPTLPLLHDILSGLSYLHSRGLVNRSVTLGNVVIEERTGIAKLANFALHHVTCGGKYVDFFLGDMALTAPEVLISNLSSTKSDCWSVGVLLLCVLAGRHILSDNSSFPKFIRTLFSPSLTLLQKCNLLSVTWDPTFSEFLEGTLALQPSKRSSIPQLLQLPLFRECKSREASPEVYPFALSKAHLISLEEKIEPGELEEPLATSCSLTELYELWRMAGGDVLTELEKWGLVRGSLPVCNLPLVCLPSGEVYKNRSESVLGRCQTVYPVCPSLLISRLGHLEPEVYYPLVETPSKLSQGMAEMAELPTVIKERNIEYQLHRIKLFSTLLYSYPASSKQIREEAWLDIPPLLRPHVWAALLDVKGDVEEHYNKLDKTQSLGSIDRQIDVDIPRCHQYNAFLSSPTGHGKLRRILKAWVIDHPDLTYWQGLDSLAAPFLVLHSGDEALAYASLRAFVRKYVRSFFLRDNSHVMTEYLTVFRLLLTFHDPELSLHIHNLGFIPELYAIPWFLTMFTHVFPLQKIFYLWDTMLLGDSSLPMYLGAAVLIQVRETLLSYEFNECILLFSDMPDVDVDRVIRSAVAMYRITPATLTYRRHSYYEPAKKLAGPAPLDGPAKYSYSFTESFLSEHVGSFPEGAELRGEVCGRIFVQDLARMLRHAEGVERRGARPTSRIVLVDIRSPEVFAVGHLPDSLNIPVAMELVTKEGKPTSEEVVRLIECRRARDVVTVVVGASSSATATFCKRLINLHFLHVAIVHGGSSALSQAGMLCAQN